MSGGSSLLFRVIFHPYNIGGFITKKKLIRGLLDFFVRVKLSVH